MILRNILITVYSIVIVLPYIFIIPALAEYNMLAYHIFMSVGLLVGTVMWAMSNYAKLSKINQAIILVTGIVAWPSSILVWAYSKWKYNRNTVFE